MTIVKEREETSGVSYAELKCKTNFSFLEGASHPDELVERAYELGITALAITDRNGVYGIPKAYWRAKDLSPLHLIVGAEVTMEDAPPLTLLAQDRGGYGLLCRILTTSHCGSPMGRKAKGEASLKMKELMDFANDSRFSSLLAFPEVDSDLNLFKELFEDRLYLFLSRTQDGHDRRRTQNVLEASKQWELPIVATNNVLYHAKERRPLQDSLTCVRTGKSLLNAGFHLLPNSERHLKSPSEMKRLFEDLPGALTLTLKIAERCTFSLKELRYRYPSEWIPQGHTAQTYLEEMTWQGARERYHSELPQEVIGQLKHELSLIQQLEFADYFLTIFDIVEFAKGREILCQGRGSAANSAVCYCLGITAIDPVRMNLLFERFISVERGEPPDIDVDFEHERREEVIQYIYKKYGRDRAAMVSAVVTYQKRSAFRELSKAFGLDVGTQSAKEVIKNFDELSASSPIRDLRTQMESLSEEMQGFPRHLSIHSGGFTLSADPMVEIVPIEPARMEGRTIIQWDKYDLDYLGLLKVDVLALGMLSALRKTLNHVGMKLHEIPSEDRKTYEMIQRGDTVGTFQIESRAQMNMSGRLRPRSFYDLVIQVAIVRPGPIVGKMVHPYLKRRHGLEKVSYPHPKLREILGKTLGIPLFQEQVMKIAIELGGFTPGEADQLRRAIGAWRAKGSIEKVGSRLLEGLRKSGIPDQYSHVIFEQLKGFAHYGFPESHSASFALLAYASAYLRCHHPAEFLCALVNSQPMGFYSNHTLVDDAKRHGVKVLPVDIQESEYHCTLVGGHVRLGLRLIRGLSHQDAQRVIAMRPYRDLADFLSKTHIAEDVLFQMAMGDLFASMGLDQRQTLWQLLANKIKRSSRQLSLFEGHSLDPQTPNLKKLTGAEAISQDYSTYGLSVRGHPMAELRKICKLPRASTLKAKQRPPKSYIHTSGLVLVRQRPPTANGVCFLTIEDEYGFLDLVFFSKEFTQYKELLYHHSFLCVSGLIERDGHSVSLIVKKCQPLPDLLRD